MKKTVVALSLVFIAATVLFRETSAKNRACVNANTEIQEMFCDGVMIPKSSLPFRKNANKCDCIDLGICKNISIKARGVKDHGQSTSGIGFCQTRKPVAYKEWTCRKAMTDKGWKSQTMKTSDWPPAEHTKRSKHCRKLKYLPCRSKMFWNAKQDAVSVDCILYQCMDGCLSCKQAGPGKCDPGMCKNGEGVNAITGETVCNLLCQVEWKSYGYRTDPAATGDSYIMLTDPVSGSKDIYITREQGYFLTVVDMNQCKFMYKNYSKWEVNGFDTLGDRAGERSLLLKWTTDATKTNLVAVESANGGQRNVVRSTGALPSFAPHQGAWALGRGGLVVADVVTHNCFKSTMLTGSNYAPVNATVIEVRGDRLTC